MEEQKEIQKQYWQQYDKYTYYVIALCVAAIGFSVYTTTGLSLKWIQIPLGIAVLFWSVSIYCGFQFLKSWMTVIYKNNTYFEIIQGKEKHVGNNPDKIKMAEKAIIEGMEKVSSIASKFSEWQYRLMFIGFLSFLIWHILKMYSNIT